MSSTPMSNEHATQARSAGRVDTSLAVGVVPMSDVDRAKRFYKSLGWRLNANFAFDNTGSCNRATSQAWRLGRDIEGSQAGERQNKRARYFSAYRSRTAR